MPAGAPPEPPVPGGAESGTATVSTVDLAVAGSRALAVMDPEARAAAEAAAADSDVRRLIRQAVDAADAGMGR